MERESEIRACNWPPELIGVITAGAARRYLEGQKKWDRKYARAAAQVARQRDKNIQRSQKETAQQIGKLQEKLGSDDAAEARTLLNAPGFSLAWALDGENPPPSSLVSRRDTAGEHGRYMQINRLHSNYSK